MGDKTTSVIERDVSRVIENAQLSRELFSVFEKTSLLTRTFYNNRNELEQNGTTLISQLADLIERSNSEEKNNHLVPALELYYDNMIFFLEQCGVINDTALNTNSYNTALLETLNYFEKNLSQSLIHTGIKIVHMENPVNTDALLPSMRESVLKASIDFANIKPIKSDTREVTPIIRYLDDLAVQLKSLIKAEEPISSMAERMMDIATDYKDAVIRFNYDMIELKARFSSLRDAKERAVHLTLENDLKTLNTANEMRNRAQKTVSNSVRFLIMVSVLGLLISAIFTYYFFFRTIRKPMNTVLEGIEIFRKGRLNHRIKLDVNDEWRVIEYELNRMAEELGNSYEELEMNKNELEKLYGKLKQKLWELEDEINQRKQTEEEISYMSYHDILTGLMNRKSFYIKLEEIINKADRNPGQKWAVMFLDLDRFKYVNETMGHDFGDELLIESAERLKKCIRKSDHVFRSGGDEFTIILENIGYATDAAKVALKIRRIIATPYVIQGTEVFNSVSIGISVFPDDGREIEVLVKNADIAMYAAKQDVSGYRFFTEDMNRKAMERIQLESSLRNAVSRDELFLTYQPLVNETGGVIGLEALLRWRHPSLGLIPPSVFIPIAEENGSIVNIGKWVMKTAVNRAKEWHEKGYDHLYIAVNLSARQLKEPDLVPSVREVLQATGFNPAFLKLEVTESAIMEEPEKAVSKMKLLKETGIGFSVDDFGTGYSSLSYLKRFPIDTLKIDRSFVKDSQNNKDDREIIKTIIAMAKNLNIETVAEGVETEEQQMLLKSMGCRIMQGYLFGEPEIAEQVEKKFKPMKKRTGH